MNDNIYDENNMHTEEQPVNTTVTSPATNENAGGSGYEVEELIADGAETVHDTVTIASGPATTQADMNSTAPAAPVHDNRYDKYAAPVDNNNLNGRRPNFNPYTGERINYADEMNNGTEDDVRGTVSTAGNAYGAASHTFETSGVTSQAGEPTYGSATPAQNAGYSYNTTPAQGTGYSYGTTPAQNNGSAYGSSATVQGTEFTYGSGAATQNTEFNYGSGATSQNTEFNYGSGTATQNTEFTYGSGAPTQTSEEPHTYVSSYGTIYKNKKTDDTRTKRHMPGWLKVLLSAAAFGVIAAAVFIGTNKLYSSFNTSGNPTVTEDTASKKRNIINQAGTGDSESTDSSATDTAATPVKKNNGSDSVSSAQALTGNESTYTDVSAVVENSLPSIVQINCKFNTQSFFGTYQSSGAGSGIIIGQTDSELLIATNNHVVENALDVKVTFNDDSEAEAYIKGTDAYADLAVVAVDISNLSKETINNIKVAVIGDSDSVKVGQMAIAIGNALGYGTSTTVGYISAKDREVTVEGRTMTLLQTDAAINPGNSGGALLNIKGEVIGINSVKYQDTSVEGMGFAIPISRAVDILNELASREVLKDSEKGYLGVQMSTVTSDFANAYGWPTGVYVNTVIAGSPAEAAEIMVGDIITKINSVTVQTTTDLRNEITSYRAGTEVTFTVQRLSKGRFKEMEIKVTLGVNPEYAD